MHEKNWGYDDRFFGGEVSDIFLRIMWGLALAQFSKHAGQKCTNPVAKIYSRKRYWAFQYSASK